MAVLRVPFNISWNGPGSPGLNVWSVRVTDGQVSEGLAGALAALHTFYDSLRDSFAPGGTITLGDVTDRETQEIVPVASWAPVLSASTSAAAPALQVCFSWRTSLAARRGMGRTFIGPLSSQVVQSDGTIVETVLADYRAWAQTLIDDSAGNINGWAIGVWGLQSKAPSGTVDYASLPHVHRDIVAVRIRDQFAVLRSRRD